MKLVVAVAAVTPPAGMDTESDLLRVRAALLLADSKLTYQTA